MLYIIVGIIVLCILLALAGAIFRAIGWIFEIVFKTLGIILITVLVIAWLIFLGIPMLFGLLLNKISILLHLRPFSSFIIVLTPIVIFLMHPDFKSSKCFIQSIDSYKYIVSFIFFYILFLQHSSRLRTQSKSEPLELLAKATNHFHEYLFASCFLLAEAFFFLKSTETHSLFSNDSILYFLTNAVTSVKSTNFYHSLSANETILLCFTTVEFFIKSGKNFLSNELIFFFLATAVQIYSLRNELYINNNIKKFYKLLLSTNRLNVTEYVNSLGKPQDEILFYGVSIKMINDGYLEELNLNNKEWYFNKNIYQIGIEKLDTAFRQQLFYRSEEIVEAVIAVTGLPEAECQDFIERYIHFGDFYDFENGRFFVHYSNGHRIKTCTACGLTVEIKEEENNRGEWYCTDICRRIEELCLKIKNKTHDEFFREAEISGFIIMEAAKKWNENHRMFGISGQGHGYAAEKANDLIDKLTGKKVVGGVGDNNAKDGPDRIVDGCEIQTKYYNTARGSINAAFTGEGDSYRWRYFDSDGKPMPIEVPKDQYERSVKELEIKIKAGNLREAGITDPEDAKKLVRRGNITYAQAQNITKFGTIESITYDLAEGVVVGVTAGSISFGISAFTAYINTKDAKESLRIAVISAAKATGKSTIIYVCAQQLHRVETVQKILLIVDANKLSPSLSKLLSKGMGINKSGLTKALRGTIVTSVVVIAVTTGPDLIKLIRGRVSQAQFMKNLAVTTSGVIGGTVGYIAGGALLSPLGPAGVFFGSVGGGVLGGIIAASITDKFAKKLMQEDKDKMLKIIQHQIEYLAKISMLTCEELENLSANLEKVITPETLENIHASKNRRALANLYIKPVIVSVIKQRPSFNYNDKDVINACAEVGD